MNIVKVAIGIVLMIFAFGCASQPDTVSKEININQLKPAAIDTAFTTNLTVIKVYPALGKCEGSAEHPNVYICKNNASGDTLYVFEPCKKVSPLAADNSKEKDHFCIINNKTLTTYPKKIHADLPEDVNIPQNATYVFNNVYVLTE